VIRAAAVSVHDYRVFGLKVRSELELPDLFADRSDAAPDVTISRGSVNAAPDPGLHAEDGAMVLVIRDVARFRIAGGSSIIVDPGSGVPARNVRLFLLGSAFGALLHQRGLLPLHANAVEIGGKAVAFTGASGAGKSTLAAWFHDSGCRILADDICVVRLDSGRPVAFRGVARLRLWRDALEASGRRAEDHVQSAMLEEIRDKFDVPLGADRAARAQLPLAAVYVLDRGDQFSVARMGGAAAAEAVFANTYRGNFIGHAGTAQVHFRTCTELANAIPVYRLCRAWGLAAMDRQNGLILRHALECTSAATPTGDR